MNEHEITIENTKRSKPWDQASKKELKENKF